MQCQEWPLNQAEGLCLFSELKLGTKIFPQGHQISAEDLIVFKMHGLSTIFAATVDDDDLSRNTALGMIAARLAGEGTAYAVNADGHCRIIAAHDGVLKTAEERVGKFNCQHPMLLLNTAEPYSLVKTGEIIADLQLTVPFINRAEIDELILRLSGNVALLQVAVLQNLPAALVYARQQDTTVETKHFTAVVKQLVKDFSAYGVEFAREYDAVYAVELLADVIEKAIKSDVKIIYILPPLPTVCAADIIPTAVGKIVDEMACCRLPQLDNSDLLLAAKHGIKMIAVPYHYGQNASELVVRCMRQALYSEQIHPEDFAHLPAPLLPTGRQLEPEQKNSLIAPVMNAASTAATIGVVVLAAGIGSRSGRNKLMVKTATGKPLFMSAVEAALRSLASPVFVITGFHNDEMADYLAEIDVNVLYNQGYRSGIKTSIDLGLGSMPSFCQGAILLPADMPGITAADLDRMIAAFQPEKEKQVLIFEHNSHKANPVLWSKALYPQAELVPENADIRPIFLEHCDYLIHLDDADDDKFLDVNYPSDLEKITHS